MADINDTGSHNGTPSNLRMRHAPIYQLSPEATADDIGNHIDLQLGRVQSMLMALVNVGEGELTKNQTEECLYACIGLIEEVDNLRGFVKYGERL